MLPEQNLVAFSIACIKIILNQVFTMKILYKYHILTTVILAHLSTFFGSSESKILEIIENYLDINFLLALLRKIQK